VGGGLTYSNAQGARGERGSPNHLHHVERRTHEDVLLDPERTEQPAICKRLHGFDKGLVRDGTKNQRVAGPDSTNRRANRSVCSSAGNIVSITNSSIVTS